MAKQSPTKGIGGHHRGCRGRTDDWITPPEIIDALGPFDLDPCACVPQPWPTAKKMHTAADDGLNLPWHGRVWLNPPYGPAMGKWLSRLADHGDGIALVFARTETTAFHECAWSRASAMLFLLGRLHFYTPAGERSKHNAGGPSVLIAYGSQNADLLHASLPGAFVQLHHERS